MMKDIRAAVVMLAGLALITGFIYPLGITVIGGALFPHQAGGSLIERDGHVVGSMLIGQSFQSVKYFHGRPSATTAPDPNDPGKTVESPYNAASSAGSNLGPTSKALAERIKSDVTKLNLENPEANVPVDLVTASGSGLDPDISPEAAYFQIPRVAKVRGLSERQLRTLVGDHVEGRTFGFLGEPRINVLSLNMALDRLSAR
jgi:K+-transporting ATPase ATPase C chain